MGKDVPLEFCRATRLAGSRSGASVKLARQLERIDPSGVSAQFAGFANGYERALVVDAIGNQSVRTIATAKKKIAIRLDAKGAGHLFARLLAQRAEQTSAGIDREHGDAIVAAIGGVDRFAGGVNMELGIAVFTVEACVRQCR